MQGNYLLMDKGHQALQSQIIIRSLKIVIFVPQYLFEISFY